MFDSIIYERRRKALRDKVHSGIILILGNNEAPANYPDNCYKYRQDSTFLYFFGQSHPGYAGVLDIESGEDIFFGNDVDIDDIILVGPHSCPRRKVKSFSNKGVLLPSFCKMTTWA